MFNLSYSDSDFIYPVKVRCDWLAFGVYLTYKSATSYELLNRFLEIFDVTNIGKSRFYEKTYQTYEGVVLHTDLKQGLKNAPYAFEAKGSAFSTEQGYNKIQDFLGEIQDMGFSIKCYRIDVCGDIQKHFEDIEIESKRMPFGYYLDENKICTGFWCGRGDIRYRLYDKWKEQGKKESDLFPWWRFEIQLRGEFLKMVVGKIIEENINLLNLETLVCEVLGDKEKCYLKKPEGFQEIFKLSQFELPRYKAKEIHPFQKIENFWKKHIEEIRKFYYNLSKNYPNF